MKYTQNTIEVGTYCYDTFKAIVDDIRQSNEFPKPFEFTVSKTDDCNYSIFMQGNKNAGNDFELNCWKTVPVLKCEVCRYSVNHPTLAGQEFVDLRVNYSGFWGSEYGDVRYIKNGFIKKHLEVAIRTAIKDFTIQETI